MTASRGFSLVSAIFLMVVLVILGTALVSVSSVQHTSSAQLVQVARANYAARAGAEWVAAQPSTWCAGGPYPMESSFTLPAPMSGFTIAVSCTRSDHTLEGVTQKYFVVDVTASSGAYGGPDYVRRKLRTKMLVP
ncbi:MAG: type IV pilus modification PilV family protein [Gammaproteobacteria bacterium]